MDKLQQRTLAKWLKLQSQLGKKWLYLTITTAFFSGLFLVAQAALLAHILQQLIIEKVDKTLLINPLIALAVCIGLRAILSFYKDKFAYSIGESVRVQMRQLLLDKLHQMGPATIQGKPAGSWASLLLEQVDDMHDFFARYLPQLTIAVLLPFVILVAVFPLNWAAGLIFLCTAPLVPLFMALVGMGAAEANRRNFKALQRLSGHFYDRLRGLATIRLFNQVKNESDYLHQASDIFRKRTMEVLRLAFLSSAVLEFFTALSIALTAVYFGFSYLGELNFGHYGVKISLFTGVFVLLLAPEFYQPLRDLGSFYHAKSQALGAADSIVEFLNTANDTMSPSEANQEIHSPISIQAKDLVVLSLEGKTLLGPVSFTINAGEQVAIIGQSGSGKTSLLNALLGFLPYQGSLKIAGIEFNQLNLASWRKSISWVGQNPQLFHGSIKENICLSDPQTPFELMQDIAKKAHVDEFAQQFIEGYDYIIGDRAGGISVGQAQRIALARALLQNGNCWFLDEPTASLDSRSEQLISDSLENATINKTTLWVTHRLDKLERCSQILIIEQGKLVATGNVETLKQSDVLQKMMLADGNPINA